MSEVLRNYTAVVSALSMLSLCQNDMARLELVTSWSWLDKTVIHGGLQLYKVQL